MSFSITSSKTLWFEFSVWMQKQHAASLSCQIFQDTVRNEYAENQYLSNSLELMTMLSQFA